ncbi:MAG: hypothetical protein PHG64_14540 [Paludibacter sp.]|nr:hypothetical protein [Paludibacter sp.]
MTKIGVKSDTQTAFGMHYSAEAILKDEFKPEEITSNRRLCRREDLS